MSTKLLLKISAFFCDIGGYLKKSRSIQCIVLIPLFFCTLHVLYYHSYFNSKYYYKTKSLEESKEKNAFLWEYLPSKDTIYWNGLQIFIHECYMEHEIYTYNNQKYLINTHKKKERIIFDYKVKDTVSYLHTDYYAILKKYNHLISTKYDGTDSLSGKDTLCLVFYEKKIPIDSVFLYPSF